MRHRTHHLAAGLATALLAALPAAAAAQAPANDTVAGATALPLDRPVLGTTVGAADDFRIPASCYPPGRGHSNSVAPGPDVVLRFTAPSSGTYGFRVRLRPGATGPNFVLWTAAALPAGSGPHAVTGCTGASDRIAGSAQQEELRAPLTAGEELLLVVDAATATAAAFELVAERVVVADVEPNGSPAAANPAVCGGSGVVAGGGDQDFFALGSAPAGSRVFAVVDGAAAPGTDSDLRITSGTATLEYDDFDAPAMHGQPGGVIAGAVAPGGPLFAQVLGYQASTVVDPYRLFSVVRPPVAQAATEVEPNGTAAQATVSGYARGAITSGDVDVFRVAAQAGDVVLVGLDRDPLRDGTPLTAAAISLVGPDGTTLADVVDAPVISSAPQTGNGPFFARTPNAPGTTFATRVPASGTYQVVVRQRGSATGDYLLSASSSCDGALAQPDRTVTVRNVVQPTDASAFALKVNGTTVNGEAYDGGSGSLSVPDASAVTVAAEAIAPASLGSYTSSVDCGGGRTAAGASISLAGVVADTTCVITHVRRQALSIALGSSVLDLGRFAPHTGPSSETYDVTVPVQLTSPSADVRLTVDDTGTGARDGRLVNGAFALREPLRVLTGATDRGGLDAPGGVAFTTTLAAASTGFAGTEPVTLRQSIAPNEGLRSGAYGTTVTFRASVAGP